MKRNTIQKINDLNEKFSVRSERFQEEFRYLTDMENAFGIRFTAIPETSEIHLDSIFCCGTIVEKFKEPHPRVFIQKADSGKRILDDMQYFSGGGFTWHTIPHGVRQVPAVGDTKFPVHTYRELHSDGLVEMGFVSDFCGHNYGDDLCLLSDLPIAVFANLAVWADRIRSQTPISTAEYIIEMEICTKGRRVILTHDYTAAIFAIRNGTIFPPGTKESLRCSLGDSEEIPECVASFYLDFWNLFPNHGYAEKAVFTIEELNR